MSAARVGRRRIATSWRRLVASSVAFVATVTAAPARSAADGPAPSARRVLLAPGRPVLVVPGARPRVVAHLHGNCHDAGTSAARWAGATRAVGTLVVPTGNTVCGDAGVPATGPLWEAPVADVARDLDAAIAKASAVALLDRAGGILTGYSRGAWLARLLARRAPGRWPGLVLVEGGAPLEAPAARALAAAGVRAVALVAGAYGAQRAPMAAAAEVLEAAGVRARLVVVPKMGHPYVDGMDAPMAEALGFVAGVVDAAPSAPAR